MVKNSFTTKKSYGSVGSVFLMAALLVVLTGCGEAKQKVADPEPSEPVLAASPKIEPSIEAEPIAPQRSVLVAGYPVALTEDDLSEATSYIRQNDSLALGQMVEQGRLTMSKAGVAVHQETGGFSGRVKFRVIGSTDAFWTLNEAITTEAVVPASPQPLPADNQSGDRSPVPAATSSARREAAVLVGRVTGSRVNVRASPSMEADSPHYGLVGDRVEVISHTENAENGFTWYYVEFNSGARGWVRSDVVRMISD